MISKTTLFIYLVSVGLLAAAQTANKAIDKQEVSSKKQGKIAWGLPYLRWGVVVIVLSAIMLCTQVKVTVTLLVVAWAMSCILPNTVCAALPRHKQSLSNATSENEIVRVLRVFIIVGFAASFFVWGDWLGEMWDRSNALSLFGVPVSIGILSIFVVFLPVFLVALSVEKRLPVRFAWGLVMNVVGLVLLSNRGNH